ncbi:MAG: hypothetical protein RL115_1251, partial [Bacteroidota bacterium]
MIFLQTNTNEAPEMLLVQMILRLVGIIVCATKA